MVGKTQTKTTGFTIVELLIVIVVIAILAAITIVAFNGIQDRARDSQRVSDIKAITKALEMYYLDNDRYPAGSGSTTPFNTYWSTTADSGWANLRAALVPKYMSELPSDPAATSGIDFRSNTSGWGYAYYANTASYCGAAVGKMYILVYRMAKDDGTDDYIGDCSTNVLQYGAKNYRVVK